MSRMSAASASVSPALRPPAVTRRASAVSGQTTAPRRCRRHRGRGRAAHLRRVHGKRLVCDREQPGPTRHRVTAHPDTHLIHRASAAPVSAPLPAFPGRRWLPHAAGRAGRSRPPPGSGRAARPAPPCRARARGRGSGTESRIWWCRSRCAVGSSSSSTSGSCASARASRVRWRSPPESVVTVRSARCDTPARRSAWATANVSAADGAAKGRRDRRGGLPISTTSRTEKSKATCVSCGTTPICRAESRADSSRYRSCPANRTTPGGAERPGQCPHQRGLAGPVRPDHADQFAGPDAERQIFQDRSGPGSNHTESVRPFASSRPCCVTGILPARGTRSKPVFLSRQLPEIWVY